MNKTSDPSLYATLLQPLVSAAAVAHHHRSCPSLPDAEWLTCCVNRALHQEPSGRAFLQRLSDRDDREMASSTYFDANATARRLRLLKEVSDSVGDNWDTQAHAAGLDPFANVSCLSSYAIFAGDGHYLEAATHDKPIDGTRYAVGHFFGLDLRTHRMFSMAVAESGGTRKREHDMRALKRMDADILRRGTPQGRKVIWVWDRAGIDALQWQKWKQQHGIYFISRAKDNMTLEKASELEFDADDPINHGVTSFTLVTVNSQILRCVHYRDPATGKRFVFLTSLTTIPPGVIAVIYKSRWDIEKTFDETKRKLGEKKSWGSSDISKQIQAEAIALTYTLMLMLEHRIRVDHNLTAEDDARRRAHRLQAAIKKSKRRGCTLSPIIQACWLRATQRGLRFIRWLRSMLDRRASLSLAVAKLRVAWKLTE